MLLTKLPATKIKQPHAAAKIAVALIVLAVLLAALAAELTALSKLCLL
jgi:hypothetical protein